jgi:hypothetical protein
MKLIVTGATGFIGTALCNELAKEHNVIALTRNPHKASFKRPVEILKWNPNALDGWENCLENSDAVVNLAGTNIASGRWTKKLKAKILNSRINSSKILLQAIKKTNQKPKTFIIASATGFYGSQADNQLDETSDKGRGFLAEVCSKIENIAADFQALDIRTIMIRTAVVLGTTGGALPKMILPFKFYLGGHWGCGKQWLSWISLTDEIAAIKFLLEDDNLQGAFNLTSPEPKTNRDFFRTLAGVMNKPCFLPMPAFFLKTILGQMADEMFLSSQKAYPKNLLAAGFKFKYPDLNKCFKSLSL